MKKILSIALIAALVITSAFAAYSGSATIKAGVDLDSKNYGFVNATDQTIKFGFDFATGEGASAGEGDLRAEIAAKFSASLSYEAKNKANNAYEETVNPATFKVKGEITKANIIYKDVTVGILGAGKSATYAADYHKNNDGTPKRNAVKSLSGVPGFTVSAFGYNGGFGFNGNSDAETYKLLAHAETKSYDLAEGVTAQAAAGIKLTETAKDFGVSAKAALSKDLLSASIAADFAVSEKVGLEVAAKAAYDFVSADVYFFSVDGFETNVLDAKLAASKAVSETVTVGGSVEVINALADAREVNLGANVKAVVAPVTLDTSVSYAVFAKDFKVSAEVSYAAELFTAKAGLTFGTTFGTDDTSYVYASASISSDKIVDGATLSLAYAPASDANSVITNYLKDDTKLGTIYASATISF